MKILFFSSDGYRESLNLEHYATSIDGIKELAIAHEAQFGNTIKRASFKVDEEIQKITYEYRDVDGTECEGSCYYTEMIEHNGPEHKIDLLRTSLERTANRLESVLARKVVRDADETLSEARSTLKQTEG